MATTYLPQLISQDSKPAILPRQQICQIHCASHHQMAGTENIKRHQLELRLKKDKLRVMPQTDMKGSTAQFISY
jgi:hypothetical protein